MTWLVAVVARDGDYWCLLKMVTGGGCQRQWAEMTGDSGWKLSKVGQAEGQLT